MENNVTSDVTEKELCLTQIRYLEEQLESYQLKHDELEKEEQDLVCQLNAIEKDKRDATELLKRFVVAKEKKLDELGEQLEAERRAARRDRKLLELQHSHNVQELEQGIAKLHAETTEQAAEIEEQEEQLVQLEQTWARLESLKEQLIRQRAEHDAAVDKLKDDSEFMKRCFIEHTQYATDLNIEMKTAIILKKERDKMSAWVEEQQHLVRDRESLQETGEVLRDRARSMSDEKDQIQRHVDDIIPKGLARKEEAELLRRKCLQLEVELEHVHVDFMHQLASMEELRETLDALLEENGLRAAQLGQLEAELQTQSSRARQLDGVKQEAAVILRHILKLKTQSQDSEKSSCTPWKMERLLDILESSAPPGTRSTLHRSPKPRSADLRPAGKLCSRKTSSCGNLPTPPRPPRPPRPRGLVRIQDPPLQTDEPNPENSSHTAAFQK